MNNNSGCLSLSILSKSTEDFLCSALNTQMILPTEEGLLRDYRGLAEKLGITLSQIRNESNPTGKLLQIWQSTQKDTYRINTFLEYLEELDRFDIVDDCEPLIQNDVQLYEKLYEEQSLCKPDPTTYDATILYVDEDFEFVRELVHKMENQYNLRIFVKDRDLKAGEMEMESMLVKIAQQCDKLIVVLTPDFIKSETNKYFLAYAQTIAIEQKARKIIPCMYKKCQVPLQLMGLHTIYYDADNKWFDFWSKLAKSINFIQNPTLNSQKCLAQDASKVENVKPNKASSSKSIEKSEEILDKPIEKVTEVQSSSKNNKKLHEKCKSASKKFYSLGKSYLKNLQPSKSSHEVNGNDKSKSKKTAKKKIAIAL